MANLISIGDNKYFKSKDVKVFPSSFRGAFKSGTAYFFNTQSSYVSSELNT